MPRLTHAALATVTLAGCGPQVAGWETGTSGAQAESGADGAAETDTTSGPGTADTGPRAQPPPACAEWTLEVFATDASSSTAKNLTATPEGLILAGVPASNGIRGIGFDGALQWEYPQLGSSAIKDVVALADGSLVSASQAHSSQSPSSRELRMAWIANDQDGWIESMGPVHYLAWVPIDLRVHPEGGLVVSTYDSQAGGADASLRTLRVDDSGQVLWSQTRSLGGLTIGDDMHGSMELLPNGDIVQVTRGDGGLRALRLGADGSVQWDALYPELRGPTDVITTPDSDVFVLGEDATVMRISGDGSVVWTHGYDGGQGAALEVAVWDPDLQVLIAAGGTGGFADSPGDGARTWATVVGGDGGAQWQTIEDVGTPGHILDMELDPTSYRAFFSGHGANLYLGAITLVPCP
jgi:hypothetical protein